MQIVLAVAINFDTALSCFTDISAYRGASLAMEDGVAALSADLEDLPRRPDFELIFHGGSQIAFRLPGATADEAAAFAESVRATLGGVVEPDGRKIPTGQMCWLVETAPVENGDERQALDAAMLKISFRRRRAPSAPPSPGRSIDGARGKALLCPVDPNQLADPESRIWVSPGQFDTSPGAPGPIEIAVSRRAKLIREYGRVARRAFYRRRPELAGLMKGIEIADNLHEIVERPPAGVSESAAGKMAVFYVDGVGFGELRAGMATEKDGLGRFADFVRALFYGRLLRDLLQMCGDGEDQRRYFLPGDKPRLRLETLMLGGEDWSFVAPGWLAAEIIDQMVRSLEQWNAARGDNPRASVRIGCLICPVKTPIVRARNLAHDISEEARPLTSDAGHAAIDIELIESIEPPVGGLDRYRASRFGAQPKGAFGFTDDDWRRARSIWPAFADCPKSQIRRMLGEIERSPADSVEAVIKKRLDASRDTKRSFEAAGIEAPMADGLPGRGDAVFRLKRMLDLWEYATSGSPARRTIAA